ncbi:MAG: sugar ABC transporter ATP-binding protein [Pseudomonadota bacterium]|nr:sugar ABC transporter ATP-binding protein [Pseudomonadota bacterium]
MDKILISTEGISKQFASVEVLSNVDLDLRTGEIHALLGENGAGKSTFAKILAGVHKPTKGIINLNDRKVEIASPIVAQELGIALIHQEPISFPHLSVAENLVMGRKGKGPLAWVNWSDMINEAQKHMHLLGVEIEVTRNMEGLSIADQQMVEIARAIASDAKLIIMDEPTAPLTPREVETLFGIARQLREEGRTIIFISHRLEEVRMICDRVTIFRDGEKISTSAIDEISDEEVIRLMIGRPLGKYMRKHNVAIGAKALSVSGLSLKGAFQDINFEIKKGEIVGVGGLVGAGRTDVARALFGITPADSGSIRVDDKLVQITNPSDAINLGIAYVPEDRAIAGIFRSLSVEHNLTAAIPNKIAPHAIIKSHKERAFAEESIDKLSVRLASINQPIVELSGGNQQKAILARWLHTDPKILILDEPTRGIDIGVKAEFYDMIGNLAESGRAILLISSELPELLALCDRILVMSEGQLTADIRRENASQELIMKAAVPRVASS